MGEERGSLPPCELINLLFKKNVVLSIKRAIPIVYGKKVLLREAKLIWVISTPWRVPISDCDKDLGIMGCLSPMLGTTGCSVEYLRA